VTRISDTAAYGTLAAASFVAWLAAQSRNKQAKQSQ